MLLEIFIFLFSLLFFIFYGRMLYCRFTLPPGPIPLPIFGNLLHLNKNRPQNTIQEWSKKYGPVFTMWMANSPTIIITDYDIMKDALTRHGDQLISRYRSYTLDRFTHGNFGIAFSTGDTWREQRRFSVQILHNFGMGRNIMEAKILTQARNFSNTIMEEIQISKGPTILDLHDGTARCVANVIASLIFGHGFPKGDPKFEHLTRLIDESFKLQTSIPILLVNSYPWLRHIPLFGHFGIDELQRQEQNLVQFVTSEIESHKEELKNRLDNNEEPLDFVEAYLKEMKRREDASEDMSYFGEWQLVAITIDLITAGMETTVTTLKWAYLAMVKFPHIQEKIFQEIDHVIGPDRSPSLSDRSSMPYVMATLNEVQRWGNILPINFARTNESDFELGGYKLPKNVEVIPQISVLAIDEKVFPEPDKFIPEHFLEMDGKTLRKIDQFAPFSLGKRNCPGEGLARAELFLIFVHTMQHFELVLPPGAPQPCTEPELGLTSAPQSFQVLVKLR